MIPVPTRPPPLYVDLATLRLNLVDIAWRVIGSISRVEGPLSRGASMGLHFAAHLRSAPTWTWYASYVVRQTGHRLKSGLHERDHVMLDQSPDLIDDPEKLQ